MTILSSSAAPKRDAVDTRISERSEVSSKSLSRTVSSIDSPQPSSEPWRIGRMAERVAASRELFTERAASTRYPIRAIRYWWTHCAILAEVARRTGTCTVADVGCSTGLLRRYTGPIERTDWIGLDWSIDPDILRARGYGSWHTCDFDRPLPLADESVDVAVHLHVIEHLLRPEFAFGELARILKPGGVLLAGSPVMPPVLSRIRERQHRAGLARGRTALGRHINSMDVPRWKRFAREHGLEVEIVQGAFFMRWSGFALENHAWWARLNLAWGAAFPSFAGEAYLALRKPMR